MFQPVMGVGGDKGFDKKPETMEENLAHKPEETNLDALLQRMGTKEKELLDSSGNFENKIIKGTKIMKIEDLHLHGSIEGERKFGEYLGQVEDDELNESKREVEELAGGGDKPKEEGEIKKDDILTRAIEGDITDDLRKSADWQGLSGQEKLMYEWINGMKSELQGLGLSQEEINNFFTNKTFGYLMTGVSLNPLEEKDRPNVLALKNAIGNFYRNSDGGLKKENYSESIADDNTKVILNKVAEFSPQIGKDKLYEYAGYGLEKMDKYLKTDNPELKIIFDKNVQVQDSYYDLMKEGVTGMEKMDPKQAEMFGWLNKLVNTKLPDQGINKESLAEIFLNKKYEDLFVGSKWDETSLSNYYGLVKELQKMNLPEKSGNENLLVELADKMAGLHNLEGADKDKLNEIGKVSFGTVADQPFDAEGTNVDLAEVERGKTLEEKKIIKLALEKRLGLVGNDSLNKNERLRKMYFGEMDDVFANQFLYEMDQKYEVGRQEGKQVDWDKWAKNAERLFDKKKYDGQIDNIKKVIGETETKKLEDFMKKESGLFVPSTLGLPGSLVGGKENVGKDELIKALRAKVAASGLDLANQEKIVQFIGNWHNVAIELPKKEQSEVVAMNNASIPSPIMPDQNFQINMEQIKNSTDNNGLPGGPPPSVPPPLFP